VTSGADQYRQLAREFHFMARNLPPGEERSALPKMAEEWDRLADQHEHASNRAHRDGDTQSTEGHSAHSRNSGNCRIGATELAAPRSEKGLPDADIAKAPPNNSMGKE
jgi:hypothetical protein